MHFPVVGIVAEYNPFHLGHLYHLRRARELAGAGAAIAVLSSNFVQRGEPAMTDKWSRAAAALACGADLVLELPAVFSCHNAGVFANAAVDILGSTGIVTSISFGVESADWDMHKVISILIEEPQPFKTLLKEYLGNGNSFVEARALALDKLVPGSAEHLRCPNNTLALSYLTRIRQKNWHMLPIPIKRSGSAHNDRDIAFIASSAAIRAAIADGRTGTVETQLPPESAQILKNCLCNGRACVDYDKLWRLLRAVLLRSPAADLADFAEMGEGIEYRLKEASLSAGSFQEWVDACTSRRYPAGRIRRHGMHVLLGIGQWENRAFQRLGPAYIRPLSMNDKGRMLLHEIKNISKLPIITKCGAASAISAYAGNIMKHELLAAELWEQIIPAGTYGKEHARKIIIK